MAKHSIFEIPYVIDPKLDKSVGFLAVASDSQDALREMGFSPEEANNIATNGFTHIIIQNVSETHVEAYMAANTLSDTVSYYSTGAVPIGVVINGYIMYTPDKNDLLKFLKFYSDKIRGTQQIISKEILYFGYKDTLMRLRLQNIALTHDAYNEAMVNIAITGLGFMYTIRKSEETSTAKKSTKNSFSDSEYSFTPSTKIFGL